MSRKTFQRTLRLFAVGAICLFALSQVSAGEVIIDQAHGFNLTLPDGFSENEALAAAQPNIIHAFASGDPNDETFDIFLVIEKMRGTIGREPLKRHHLPPGFQGKLFTAAWQGFELEGFEVPEQLADIAIVTYNVQVPLERAAIQVKLFGPRDRETEMKRLLTQILAGLKGKSNWMRSALPVSPVSEKNYPTVLLTLVAVYVLGGLFALFLISRRSREGVVLGIAALIYFASWTIDGSGVREVMVLAGATRMLGVAGIILGIIDSVRKRRAHRRIS